MKARSKPRWGRPVHDEDERTPRFLHAAPAELDTYQEQAGALMRELRESFAPSYLTLISIIEGVLLGFMFELMSEAPLGTWTHPTTALLLFNNVLLIVVVWNEYRMGSAMLKWVPRLLDAMIPFGLGTIQAALMLTLERPLLWLGWLAAFYFGGLIAFVNMYAQARTEEINAFALHQVGGHRWVNLMGCATASLILGAVTTWHAVRRVAPGPVPLLVATAFNATFLARGEIQWLRLIRAARRVGAMPVAPAAGTLAQGAGG